MRFRVYLRNAQRPLDLARRTIGDLKTPQGRIITYDPSYKDWLTDHLAPAAMKGRGRGSMIHTAKSYSKSTAKLLELDILLDDLQSFWASLAEPNRWLLYMYLQFLVEGDVIEELPYPLHNIVNWEPIPKSRNVVVSRSWFHPEVNALLDDFIERTLSGSEQRKKQAWTILVQFLDQIDPETDLKFLPAEVYKQEVQEYIAKFQPSEMYVRRLRQVLPLWINYISDQGEFLSLEGYRVFVFEKLPGPKDGRTRRANTYRQALDRLLEEYPDLASQQNVRLLLRELGKLESWALWFFYWWLIEQGEIQDWPIPLRLYSDYEFILEKSIPHLLSVVRRDVEQPITSIVWTPEREQWFQEAQQRLDEQTSQEYDRLKLWDIAEEQLLVLLADASASSSIRLPDLDPEEAVSLVLVDARRHPDLVADPRLAEPRLSEEEETIRRIDPWL